MNNPKVYPGKVKKFVDNPIKGFEGERIEVEQQNEGIDLLTHVAIAAMNGFISYGNQRGNDIKASFDLAEAFLEERETRLNKIK